MVDLPALIQRHKGQLTKALTHLEYSEKKAAALSSAPASLSEDQLEVWEGFVARFSRATDICLNKLLRSFVLQEDAGFHGTLRDLLNYAEKHAFVSDARRWTAIRELRNRAAHEYLDEQLGEIFEAVRLEAPFVVSEIRSLLKK